MKTEITFLITYFRYYKNMMSTNGLEKLQYRQKAIAGISSEINKKASNYYTNLSENLKKLDNLIKTKASIKREKYLTGLI